MLSFLFPFLRQALHNENVSLKAEIQNLQAQISDQVRDIPFYLLIHLYFLKFKSTICVLVCTPV